MFEKATKQKLRFETNFGHVSVEDLWDLPLTNSMNTCLDDIAILLNKEIKAGGDESFVTMKSTADTTTQLKFDIVKHIIDVKLSEIDAAEKATINKAKKQRILNIIANKKDQELEGTSVEELEAMVDSL